MKFTLEQALEVVEAAVQAHAQRHLNDVETIILRGAWERLDYDQIAAQNQYSTSYVSQDVAPKLWKLLTAALGEKVKKTNFKQTLQRRWEQQQKQQSAPQPSPSVEDDSPYIARPQLEALCRETLEQPGALVRIKAPQRMGKTIFISRVLEQIGDVTGDTAPGRTALLSFELADRSTHFKDLNRFLRWFCLNLTRKLKLDNALDDYWDEEGLGAKVSCTTYLEQHLLAELEQPLILALDNVDLLFSHPEVYEDFFGLLRSWHEKARTRKLWKQLRLVVIHSTDVYIRLNINQSPFNVGLPLEIPEFTLEETQQFAQQQGLESDVVEALMPLLGGHPYLLEQAFVYLRTHRDVSLAQFISEASTESGIYSSHLRQCWVSLEQEPALTEALSLVLKSKQPVQINPVAAYQLQGMGLIKLTGNLSQPRCRLYQRYFEALLV